MTASSPAPKARSIVALLAGIAIVIAYATTLGRASFQPKTFEFDLMAFYCGGAVVAEHHDPYVVEPLRACQHAIAPIFRPGSKLVVPVPLPAYDFAFLAALSHVPYAAVRIVWIALESIAFALTAVLLARLSGVSFAIVASSLVVSDLYCSSLLGQLAPFSIFGIVLAGWSLERAGRSCLFAGLVLAMIEPHLGLPAVGAVALWGGRFKIVAVSVAVFLAAVSVLVMPLPALAEYVAHVIPAQALSEANNEDQFGALYVLHRSGLSEAAAYAGSRLDYALTLSFGILFARAAARRYGDAMFAFAPVPFVLLGGPYLHVTQIAAALPAALTIAGRSDSRAARATVALLTIPWLNFVSIVTILPVAAGALFVVLRRACRMPALRAIVVVAFALGCETAAAFAIAGAPQAGAPDYGGVRATSLPEMTWKALIDAQQHGHALLSNLAKLPTVGGVVAIVVVVVRDGLGRRRTEPTTAARALKRPFVLADHP